jgi:hypothetical protein
MTPTSGFCSGPEQIITIIVDQQSPKGNSGCGPQKHGDNHEHANDATDFRVISSARADRRRPSRSRARAPRGRARAARSESNRPRIDYPKRASCPRPRAEQRLPGAHRAQVGSHVAAVGERHREVAHGTARVVPAATAAHAASGARELPRQLSQPAACAIN